MRAVDTKLIGIAESLKFIIRMATILNNEVIQFKAYGIKLGTNIRIKRVKAIFQVFYSLFITRENFCHIILSTKIDGLYCPESDLTVLDPVC